jgi:FkbH-like protein
MAARQTARAQDILAVLRHAGDPLAAAAALAAEEPDTGARQELMEAAVAAFGQRPGARTLQALTRYVRRTAKGSDETTAGRFLASGNAAGRWLGAMALEARGEFAQAAAALEAMDDRSWGEERALRLAAFARNLQRAGRIADAWRPLRDAAAVAETPQTLASIGQLLAAGERTESAPARARRRLAVVGTGTLQLWADALRPALYGAGVHAELLIGEFGQYQQEILDPGSSLTAFRPDTIAIAVDYRALGLDDVAAAPDRVVAETVDRLRQLWRACQERFAATVVQFTFEIPEIDPFGGLSAALPGGRARILQRLNLALTDAARDANVAVFDMNEAAALFGKQRWNDAGRWIAAKQYPAPDAVPFLARRFAGLVRAACGLTSKCVVLDLDNTLWGGIIGEDGLNGIRLGGDAEGEAYTAFHRYLLGLKSRGIPLAVCSKNNEADALSVFREHPESVLREADFAVFLANWEPKPDNLRRIAATLNIGIDSLVFVDDNPAERAFIRRELPDVEVPELPDDPALYADTLHRSQLFESLSFTEEDRRRAESYRQNAERAAVSTATANVDDYLASLGMKVELRPFDELNLPRIVQLINKTNQFNLTTRRTSAAEVARWMRDPACYTQFMRLRDRFGDSGLTGVLVAFREGDAFRIDTWLISCRVLGRRIEEAMIASLCSYARSAGARAVTGEYVPTAKNEQVRDIYPRLGFETLRGGPDGGLFELLLERAPLLPQPPFDIEDSTLEPALTTGDATR